MAIAQSSDKYRNYASFVSVFEHLDNGIGMCVSMRQSTVVEWPRKLEGQLLSYVPRLNLNLIHQSHIDSEITYRTCRKSPLDTPERFGSVNADLIRIQLAALGGRLLTMADATGATSTLALPHWALRPLKQNRARNERGHPSHQEKQDAV